MNEDPTVVLTVVPNETEAELLCGLLRANGVECAHRETDAIDSPVEDFIPGGPREVMVYERDPEAALTLLPEP